MLCIISCDTWPSVCLLWIFKDIKKIFYFSGLLLIFFYWVVCFLILSCMNCLYILEINPLSVASFANIFSHSEGCLFVLLMVSFAMQNVVSLIRPH